MHEVTIEITPETDVPEPGVAISIHGDTPFPKEDLLEFSKFFMEHGKKYPGVFHMTYRPHDTFELPEHLTRTPAPEIVYETLSGRPPKDMR